MAKRTSLEREVEAAFEAAYKATGDWTAAYNMVLDRVGGRTASERASVRDRTRHMVGDLLRKIQKKVMRRLKDPFTLAVDDTMSALRRDNVVKAGAEAYAEMKEARLREAEGEDDPEDVDMSEGPILYVMFNDDGSFNSWTIDYSSYFQGHGGPTAAVDLPTSWDDIEGAIGEELAQAEIFEG